MVGLQSGWAPRIRRACAGSPFQSFLPPLFTPAPAAEWLYEALSGQAPPLNSTLRVFDPHLGQSLALDVVFCEDANVHHITVRKGRMVGRG